MSRPTLRKYRLTVQASYRGEFPIDMLRYDGCFPDEERDAGKIGRSIRGEDMTAEDGTVRLVKYAGGSWKPNHERWESFGWRIVEVAEVTP